MALNILNPMMPGMAMPQVPGMPTAAPMAMPPGMPMQQPMPQAAPPPPQMVQQPSPVQGFIGNILAKLRDPNVQQAIQAAGLNLMKTPEFGKSGWDTASNALGAGMGTLNALRERDRQRGLETEDRATREQQRGIENKRGDRQVSASERNAATQETSVIQQGKNLEADNAAKVKDQERADKALEEAIRHNKSAEEIDRLRAEADKIRAGAYAGGRSGKTSAEIEKINRLQKIYIAQGMDELQADKAAIDYVTNAKGKPPRQMVLETYQGKVKQWYDQQLDPTAKPTPEMLAQWNKDAIAEVRNFEEAGMEITDRRGTITRPSAGTPPPAAAAPTQPPAVGAPQPAAAGVPGQQGASNPVTERNIETWKLRGATPEQIKILISTGGENPALYGYK